MAPGDKPKPPYSVNNFFPISNEALRVAVALPTIFTARMPKPDKRTQAAGGCSYQPTEVHEKHRWFVALHWKFIRMNGLWHLQNHSSLWWWISAWYSVVSVLQGGRTTSLTTWDMTGMFEIIRYNEHETSIKLLGCTRNLFSGLKALQYSEVLCSSRHCIGVSKWKAKLYRLRSGFDPNLAPTLKAHSLSYVASYVNIFIII